MEKEIRKEIVKEEVTHQFYCDCCNQLIGETHEFDDGYYPTLGEFGLKMFLPDGWYCINKTFCDKCRDEFVEKMRFTLCEHGFEKER